MTWIIAAIVLWIPILHLWLHALLPWWRKQPYLFFTFGLVMGVGFLLIARKIAALPSLPVFLPQKLYWYAGWGLIIAGATAVMTSIFTLGPRRFFLWAVFYPKSVERLRIQNGIFKILPHPAYFGYLLLAAGNFLLSGKLYTFLILIIGLILIPVVIYLEEKELTERINKYQ